MPKPVARIEQSEIRERPGSLHVDPRVSLRSTRATKEEREAKRRKAHAVHCPRRTSGCRHPNGPGAEAIPAGTARLPALHRGTRHAGRNQHWLSPRTGFPATGQGAVFCPPSPFLPRLNALRVDRSLCRSTGAPGPPGGGSHSSARGHRTCSVFRKCPRERRPR
jgi:hypothetical protein